MDWIETDPQVLVLALARMADALGNSFLIIILPLYIASGRLTGGAFGFSEQLITGLVLGMFGLFSSPLQPLAGRLSDRLKRRKIFVVAGLGVLTVTNASFVLAEDYVSLLVIRALQGIGVALTITATIALVNEYSADQSRGGNMGLFNTFRLIGFGGGPIFAGIVVHHGPYRLQWLNNFQLSGFEAAFYVAAIAALLSTILVILFVTDPTELDEQAGGDISIAVLASSDDSGVLDPIFTLGIISMFMALGMALLATLEPIVNTRLDQAPTMFGIEFGAFVLAQILVQIPVGNASDTYGRRPFILGGLALLVPSTLAQGLVMTPPGMIVARFFQGIAAAMVFAPALALAGDLSRLGESGSKLSVITMAFGLGVALGPILSGYLVRYGFVVPFAFGSGLAVVGFGLVYTQVRETVPAPERGVESSSLAD